MNVAVFTKPWKMPLAELGPFVRDLGLDAIELPVRPGYPVEPDRICEGLPGAARVLAESGVSIVSVASEVDEAVIAACGDAGVPIIRICVGIPAEQDYLTAVADVQRRWDAFVPQLDRHGVKIGVQNHCDRCITHAMHLHHAVGKYDPKHVGAVWDAAHNALQGEDPELALDVVASHLCMVNLKNAFWRRTSGPEAEHVTWASYWTTGAQGLADWPRVIGALHRRGIDVPICLSAEYSDESSVERLLRQDVAYVRGLIDAG
ncbi:MAG: xylose isomerase [Phycisphaeraceae bacterium]|nr:xylose isomerase [Phycisphaeraceae bacterium]